MHDEIELKFLKIDANEIEKKLQEIGADKKYSSDTKAVFFEHPKNGYDTYDSSKPSIRLRSINDKIILTHKGPKKPGKMKIREEIEVEVSDWDNTVKFFKALGFEESKIFLKKRTHYELGDTHFEIDDLGDIPPYLEIEAPSEEAVKEACDKLGIDFSQGDGRTMQEIWPERF